MPVYHLKLRDFDVSVNVPRRIRGLNSVADYITKDQAKKYAKSVTATTPKLTIWRRRKRNETNWYDSHIDAITEMLIDLRDKLRDKHGM